MNAWLFTRHADADAILRDHRNFASDPRRGTLTARQEAMLPPPEEFTMLFLDPPDHTRPRALVNKAFTSRAVNALEARIRSILASLLDAIEDPGSFDLMEAVAQPLPVIVVAEMLGVPPEDRAQFKTWSVQRAPAGAHGQPPRTRDRANRLKRIRCVFPQDHRGPAGGAAGRHPQRPRAGGGRRQSPDGTRDAEYAAPAPDRGKRDDHQPGRQRDAGAAAQSGPAPAAQGGPGPDPVGGGRSVSRRCWSVSRRSACSTNARGSVTVSCCEGSSPCRCAALEPESAGPVNRKR